MKSKIVKVEFNNKKDNIKTLFLVQTFLVIAAMAYFSSLKWNLIGEQYHPISGDTVLMGLLILSGLVGLGSIYLFNEIVHLIEKEKEYEAQALQLMQMQESNDLLRSQKHDFSNNLQVLWGMLSIGNLEKAKQYLGRYTNMLKVDEEELSELSNLSCTYLYTLLLNKAYKCKDMGIEIYYNIQPSVSLEGFNPIDIVRIFGNILDNAIYEVKELDKEYREVVVDIYFNDESYFFQVTNKGAIIPDEMREQIFKKGFTTKGNEGSGFGLYNVNELVNKYNGKISVESDVYIGTRFTINMPKI